MCNSEVVISTADSLSKWKKKSSSLRSFHYQQATGLAREHISGVCSVVCTASLIKSLAKVKTDILAVWISLQDRGPFCIFLLYIYRKKVWHCQPVREDWEKSMWNNPQVHLPFKKKTCRYIQCNYIHLFPLVFPLPQNLNVISFFSKIRGQSWFPYPWCTQVCIH